MAGIGADIRVVINDLCTEITYPERDNVTEFIDYESNTQATKPQTAEHFLLTTFVNNSIVNPGDLVHFNVAKTNYRVMNVYNETFENDIIYKQCILYKCNVVVDVFEPRVTRDPDTLVATETFYARPETSRVIAMMTDRLYGTRLDDEEQKLIQEDIKGKILYFPKSRKIAIKDRVVIDDDDQPYEVTALEKYTYPGMNIVYLEEDTRSLLYGS